MKRLFYVIILLIIISCSSSIYVMKNNRGSKQKVESVNSVSADSTNLDLKIQK